MQLQHLELQVTFIQQQQQQQQQLLQLAQLPAVRHLTLQLNYTQQQALLQLQQLPALQHLHLAVNNIQPQSLLQLAQLPALQHLELKYSTGTAAAATAHTWALLPQLRELAVDDHDDPKDAPRDLAAIVLGSAAATSLTKLYLSFSKAQPEPLDVVVVSSLTRLTRLKDLSFSGNLSYRSECQHLASGDSIAVLSSLTGLTQVSLKNIACGARITTDAAAVACNLKQLRSLMLRRCGLQLDTAEGMACLEAIGRLTQLTKLVLLDNEGLTEQGMMQLTGLSRLHDKYDWMVCNGRNVTSEVWEKFQAAIRQQQHRQ
jgi:Leucine-rich repeat (LRR) protein